MPASPPFYHNPSPLNQTNALIHKYTQTHTPRPILRDLLRNPSQSDLLIDALNRQISLIKSRLQAFEDGQITIYDRALLVLSREGRDLGDVGALELFLTEYLGLGTFCGARGVGSVLGREGELRDVLRRVSESHNVTTRSTTASSDSYSYRGTESTNNSRNSYQHQHQHHDRPERPDHHHHGPQKELPNKNGDETLHTRVTRILNVYRRAKDDYHRTLQTEGVASLPAIRFLRDTAENTIYYLRTNGLFDHALIPELEDTFQRSRDKAAQLSGGKKRHFDDGVGSGAVGGSVDGERRGERRRERRDGGWGSRGSGGRCGKRARVDSYRP